MPSVRHEAVINGPRQRAFEYVDDYRKLPEWMYGVTEFAPTTDIVQGLGAIFDATIKIGPKKLTSTAKVVQHVEDELIVMESISGFQGAMRWEFADGVDQGTTDATVTIDYTLPGGLAGRALAALIEPVVGKAVKQVESSLRAAVEKSD